MALIGNLAFLSSYESLDFIQSLLNCTNLSNQLHSLVKNFAQQTADQNKMFTWP